MKNSNIEWCDHTFNPWVGCTHCSPGCFNCYAEGLIDIRFGRVKWGKGNPRDRTSEGNWKEPVRWNRDASGSLNRPRVFCASLSDWLDEEVPIEWLADLLKLIHSTPNLDWLLLTKRPQNFKSRILLAASSLLASSVSDNDRIAGGVIDSLFRWAKGEGFPANVWIGTSIENQLYAEKRIPDILNIPAKVRFLSCEPLLGPVNLDIYSFADDSGGVWPSGIHWVICGGESGPKARPMHPDWARSLRDQCVAAGVPFLFKQWGEWHPVVRSPAIDQLITMPAQNKDLWAWCDGTKDGWRHGAVSIHIGKKEAGRELDGSTYNNFPKVK